MTSIAIVAYLALFIAVGVLFVFVNLLIGRFLRPRNPEPEKLEVYECGEPTIGSSFVQFDLRFYVVALLFLIFDVEVALFFPWATVFGKSTHLMDPALHAQVTDAKARLAIAKDDEARAKAKADEDRAIHHIAGIYNELGVPESQRPNPNQAAGIRTAAKSLAWFSLIDILVFFAVLMVGFAYVWARGDLDWVRAIDRERAAQPPRSRAAAAREPAMV